MDPIKVLLIIEVPLIGNIVASVLEDEPDIEVVATVASAQEAVDRLQERGADIAVVSVGLPDQSALSLTRNMLDQAPSLKVLMLGLSDKDQNDALRYIEAGASGYIRKDSSLKEFMEVVRLAHRGEAQVSPKIAGAMIQRLSSLARMFSAVEHKLDKNARLTSRELQVLQFIGEGLTNQEIASRLVLEVGTVKNHVHSILEKLNVSNRNEAASYLAFIKR
jgi:two-component system NarL family response regulator